jgi:HSP20 family protein
LIAGPARSFNPAFDIRETKDAYLYEADLPGMKEDGFEISLIGKRLSVRGKREAMRRDQSEKYSRSERAYGSFERTFALSDDAEPERVNAELRDGVLLIEVAKRAEPQARRVALTGAERDSDGGQQHAGAEAAAQPARGEQPPARSRPRRRRVREQRKRKR